MAIFRNEKVCAFVVLTRRLAAAVRLPIATIIGLLALASSDPASAQIAAGSCGDITGNPLFQHDPNTNYHAQMTVSLNAGDRLILHISTVNNAAPISHGIAIYPSTDPFTFVIVGPAPLLPGFIVHTYTAPATGTYEVYTGNFSTAGETFREISCVAAAAGAGGTGGAGGKIANFIAQRAALMTANGMGAARLVDRLSSRQSDLPQRSLKDEPNDGPMKLGQPPAGFAGLASDEFRGGAPAGPNGLSITGDGGEKNGRMSFAASLSDLSLANARSEAMKLGGNADRDASGSLLNARTDIWAEGVVAYQQHGELGSDGHFGMVSAGIDYLVRPGFLVGVMAQYDRMDEQSDVLGFEISGHGWMAGPYLGLRLSDNLFLDAHALWGTSDNQIAPLLTYTDNFDSDRFLASARLTGRWGHGPWTFSPSAEFVWFEDESEAYTDSNGLAIAGQSVELGRIIFGPEVSYSFTGTGGTLVVPRLALKGLWNFETPEAVTISGVTISQDDVTARLEAGVGLTAHWGARLDLEAAYDGIGANTSEAVSGKAAITFPLN